MSETANPQIPSRDGGVLRGLIVEDQALIGLSLEAYLEESGIDVDGPFVSEEEALSYLEGNTPDFAILDFSLKNGPCLALAEVLRMRKVPVIVYSGHSRRPGEADAFAEATWIEKPASRAMIVEAVARAAQMRDREAARGKGAGPIAASS